jgi:hypothetical protein
MRFVASSLPIIATRGEAPVGTTHETADILIDVRMH